MADAAPWMIVMLENGVYQLASTQSVPREALHPGSVVMVSDCNGETRAAKIVALSNDRDTVEDQMHSLEKNAQNNRVTSEIINDPEPEDYSSSGSSWAPDQQSSSDSESESVLNQTVYIPLRENSRQTVRTGYYHRTGYNERQERPNLDGPAPTA
ncbi:hypothetical protein EVAR_94760_1 [Eumeta japonica]|uniref:Uncharacterized protein n=1 Tax=Eumeta variegata TaxID=151549 RepID=A0A4C1UWB9_EUMVA|nr:hypothetical protein EVAR_94760_1 [Eumeta japonica]